MIQRNDKGVTAFLGCSNYIIYDDHTLEACYSLTVRLDIEKPEEVKFSEYKNILMEHTSVNMNFTVVYDITDTNGTIVFSIDPDEDNVNRCAELLNDLVNNPDFTITIEEIEGYVML